MDEPAPASGGRDGACVFSAELRPHASLGRRGFAALMLVFAAACLAAGALFASAGAWPVAGFLGLDLAVLWLAFRASYRWARTRELLRLTRDAFLVERVGPSGGRRRWRFQPGWLRVDLGEGIGRPGALVLSSHGRRLEIGAFLPPAERAGLAAALREALARVRAPSRPALPG